VPDRIDSLPPLRDVIRDNGLDARKSLGQNFLLDLNLTAKIARNAGDLSASDVIEIGPGPGGLTRAILLQGARSLHAVEFDDRAIAALGPLVDAAQGRLTLVHGDALKTDMQQFGQDGARVIMANLPYNIATPLLINWLSAIRDKNTGAFTQMVLMFQREVAQRIVAKPGDDAYGRLAIISNWLCDARICMDLPPSAFTPPPKVHSAVVRFVPKKPDAHWPSFRAMETVTAAAFNQRRKMIRSSLRNYRDILQSLGIDETLRAEQLSVEQFVAIAKASEA